MSAVLVMAVFGGILALDVAAAPTASATYLGDRMYCGYTPPAPNAVDTCSGWMPSTDPGYVWKVDATHHYGWWGGNFDIGTWHVIMYLYYANGTYINMQATFDFGDWAVPWQDTCNVSFCGIDIAPNLDTNSQAVSYNDCAAGGNFYAGKTWFDSYLGYDTWSSPNYSGVWAWCRETGGGNVEQWGSGYIGPWNRIRTSDFRDQIDMW
jgi:hypothetical protein